MRTLKEFVESRMARVGFSGPSDLCRKIGITTPTYYKVVNETDKSRPASREAIAEALNLREWSDLIDAWQADDVRRGLLSHPDRIDLQLRLEAKDVLERLAKEDIDRVRKQVVQSLDPQTQESLRKLFTEGGQSGGKKRRQAAKPKQP